MSPNYILEKSHYVGRLSDTITVHRLGDTFFIFNTISGMFEEMRKEMYNKFFTENNDEKSK